MQRFETIYAEVVNVDDTQEDSLQQLTQLIYRYYLTPKEQTYFRCLEMYYQNKKQRELSILLNIDQPNLSAKFAKLRRKLKVVADFLLHEEVSEVLKLQEKNKYNAFLTVRQNEVLMYLLAGNKAYHISKYLGVSPVAVHQTVNYLKRKLPSNSLPIEFLAALGSI